MTLLLALLVLPLSVIVAFRRGHLTEAVTILVLALYLLPSALLVQLRDPEVTPQVGLLLNREPDLGPLVLALVVVALTTMLPNSRTLAFVSGPIRRIGRSRQARPLMIAGAALLPIISVLPILLANEISYLENSALKDSAIALTGVSIMPGALAALLCVRLINGKQSQPERYVTYAYGIALIYVTVRAGTRLPAIGFVTGMAPYFAHNILSSRRFRLRSVIAPALIIVTLPVSYTHLTLPTILLV